MHVLSQMESITGSYGARIVLALIILFIGLFAAKFIKKIKDKILLNLSIDETIRSFIISVTNALLYFVLIIIVLTAAGVPSSYFAGLIIGLGTTIGFALKDEFKTVSNGIIILMTKPFKVGDAIKISSDISGVVAEIKLFQTTLKTFDNLIIHVNNGTMLNAGITIFNGTEPRRQDIIISVSYEDDVKKVKSVLTEIVKNNELILKEPEPLIALTEMADSSINFLVRFWTERPNFFSAKFQVLEEVKVTFDKEGISIPYPQQDVHIIQEK